MPVTMRMHTANNDGIKILGASLLRFKSETRSGRVVETGQMTYVTDSSDKLFLCREACLQLGIISNRFPEKPVPQQSMERILHHADVLNASLHLRRHADMLRLVSEILPRIKFAKQCDVTVEICISQIMHFRLHVSFHIIFFVYRITLIATNIENIQKMCWFE
jgi:hypothetical protein